MLYTESIKDGYPPTFYSSIKNYRYGLDLILKHCFFLQYLHKKLENPHNKLDISLQFTDENPEV